MHLIEITEYNLKVGQSLYFYDEGSLCRHAKIQKVAKKFGKVI